MLEDRSIDHREYLCMEDKDPKSEFAETVIENLGETGTIFTYIGYEAGVLKHLAASLPPFEHKLSTFTSRFNDLYKIMRRH